MHRKFSSVLLFLLICFGVSISSASAEDRFKCESIMIARFAGYERKGEPAFAHPRVRSTFAHPPIAFFQPIAFLKGGPTGMHSLSMTYRFGDGSDRPEQEEQKIEESMMPTKGSIWIIFISFTAPPHSTRETFHDQNLPYNRENLDNVLDELEREDPSDRYDSLSRQKLDATITAEMDYFSHRANQSAK